MKSVKTVLSTIIFHAVCMHVNLTSLHFTENPDAMPLGNCVVSVLQWWTLCHCTYVQPPFHWQWNFQARTLSEPLPPSLILVWSSDDLEDEREDSGIKWYWNQHRNSAEQESKGFGWLIRIHSISFYGLSLDWPSHVKKSLSGFALSDLSSEHGSRIMQHLEFNPIDVKKVVMEVGTGG